MPTTTNSDPQIIKVIEDHVKELYPLITFDDSWTGIVFLFDVDGYRFYYNRAKHAMEAIPKDQLPYGNYGLALIWQESRYEIVEDTNPETMRVFPVKGYDRRRNDYEKELTNQKAVKEMADFLYWMAN